jgi:hypothetical protein
MNKKTIIIISSVAGALVLGFVGYRIISRWNKTIVKDGNTTILISKDESENVEVVSGDEEASGGDKEINLPDDLQEFETQSGLGDY